MIYSRVKQYSLLLILMLIDLAIGCTDSSKEDKALVGYRVEYVEENENGTTVYKIEGDTYRYRVVLSGRSNQAEYESYYVVLTNDSDITFDTADTRFWGSDMSKWGDFQIVESGLLPMN